MKTKPHAATEDRQDEIAALVRTLRDTQARLQELAGGELDAVTDSDGCSYLLHAAQENLRRDDIARKQAEEELNRRMEELARLNAELARSNRATLNLMQDAVLASEALRKLNAELEQRVLDRTVELQAANKELEAFSYSVSHDLRAPLRAIDGFAKAFSKDYGPQLDDEGRRVVGVIRSEAQLMGRMIDGLLAFARMGHDALNLETVAPSALVGSALEQLHAAKTGLHIDVTIGDLPACVGDPVLLSQVWVNLLSNAIKYTGRRAVGKIVVGGYRKNGDVVYSVRDNGTGFDMNYSHKLFGVFQRLHSAAEFEGTGVGLALVQRIIQRHGGRIWADAKVNEGATFYFTLPAARITP
jgi:light-regulated signal transduction histidine kinase (bacteriophytochrome)